MNEKFLYIYYFPLKKKKNPLLSYNYSNRISVSIAPIRSFTFCFCITSFPNYERNLIVSTTDSFKNRIIHLKTSEPVIKLFSGL